MLWYFLVLTSWTTLLMALPTPLNAFVAVHSTQGCLHNGTRYADQSMVPTTQKCLSCVCSKKSLVCRLKVCPEMPMPPPRGCVVVQKKNTCCPYLSCARLDAFYKIPTASRIIAYLDHYERESIDRAVDENMLQRRSDDSEVDLYVCVKNGTVYKSGSAMSSSNLCSYCYCIGGTEKCVKPKCMLPVEGCKPIFVDSTCCPVRYDCSVKSSGKSSHEARYRKASNKHFLRMSQRLQRNRGCMVGSQFYVEGQKMKSDEDKPCDICFCIRGTRRCAPKKCAPALKNCIPVVPKGQCCPSSYDCGSQRDYLRAQNSRQFNLFSLIFGPEDGEGERGNDTNTEAQYPHDRQPVAEHKIVTPNAESTSEKSIFDTLREGLEFIDRNNQVLEDDTEISNHSRPTVKPSVGTSNTPVSLLDLLLGPEEDPQPSGSTESSIEEKTTASGEGFSWVDLLLGTDEEDDNRTTAAVETTEQLEATEQMVVTEPSTNAPVDYETPASIDRLDDDFDDISDSGQIEVGELWATEQESLETTTELDETTTELTSMATKLSEQTTEEILVDTTAEGITITPEIPATTPGVVQLLSTESPEVESPLEEKQQKVENKPVAKEEDLPQKLHKADSLTIAESVPAGASTHTTTAKPNGSGLLTALLDGITGILRTEPPTDGTKNRIKVDSSASQKLTSNINSKPTSRPVTSAQLPHPLPMFKPLPSHKPHIRINSKIANLTSDPFLLITNTTLAPLERLGLKTTTGSAFTTSKGTTATTTSTTTFRTTPKLSNTATTPEIPIKIPLVVTTTSTTGKPLYVKTNPTILEVDPLDAYHEPTLPPSLPNLQIIPFLPTDAVQANRKQTLYEFYHGMAKKESPAGNPLAGSTLTPALLVGGHWDTVMDKNSKINYAQSYDEGKIYPSITEPYQTFAEFPDDTKAEYIYKFKVEGPSSSVSSNAGKMDGTTSSAAFVKFDFSGSAPQMKGGFSPPTKTEGGFVPKEPLVIEESERGEISSQERYQVTPHIIDITTSEPLKDRSTKVIEITTPDPFKDVIKTEPPPDLTSLIEDKEKIMLAQKNHLVTANGTLLNENEKLIVHITTDLPKIPSPPSAPNATSGNPNKTAEILNDVVLQDNNSIESFFDLLFKEDELDVPKSGSSITTTTATVPPFRALPQALTNGHPQEKPLSERNVSIISTSEMHLPSKRISTTTEKIFITTLGSPWKTKTASNVRPSSSFELQKSPTAMETKPIEVKLASAETKIPQTTTGKTTKSPIETTSRKATTTIPTTTKTTTTTKSRPILSAPFDKLPFMDTSFEVRPNVATTSAHHKTVNSFLGLVHYKNSLNKFEGLEPTYQSESSPLDQSRQSGPIRIAPAPALAAPSSESPSLSQATSTTPSNYPATQQTTSNSLIDLSGILKLAGCNIYGRMYRVGRIIVELSTPCIECKCTEVGVKCSPLDC